MYTEISQRGAGVTHDAGSMRPLATDELAALATPAYVYDAAVVVCRYRALRAALGTELVVSLKANSLLDLGLRCYPAFIDGIELASLGELQTVVGRVAAPRYVNNPSMDDTFMQAALASGATFIVDSLLQAERLARSPKRRNPPTVMLRLNPWQLGALVPGRAADHFGMQAQDAVRAAALLREGGCTLLGVHCFAGSYSFSGHGAALVEALAPVLLTLEQAIGTPFERVNLGGGFAECWEAQPEAMERYRAALSRLPGRWTLMHEAGRAVFADAGAFVTRVVVTKRLGRELVAVCDGGIAQSFLLGMTEGSLRKHRSPQLAGPVGPNSEGLDVRFVGSSCSRSDVIGFAAAPAQLPQVGTWCVFDGCGAYHSSYTVSDFLRLGAANQYVLGTSDA